MYNNQYLTNADINYYPQYKACTTVWSNRILGSPGLRSKIRSKKKRTLNCHKDKLIPIPCPSEIDKNIRLFFLICVTREARFISFQRFSLKLVKIRTQVSLSGSV